MKFAAGGAGSARRLALVFVLGTLAAACSDASPTPPESRAPVVTVRGVEDGAVYDRPVTIEIEVDRGTYSATLDGSPIVVPREVDEFGDHLLVVTARDGLATTELRIAFSLRLQAETALIVRVMNLGENGAGGGGDAILLTDSSALGSFHALVDAGPGGAEGDDDGFVARRLEALGVDTLQFVLLSHAHSDHYAGLPDVLEEVHVGRFIYNGQVRSAPSYQAVLAAARAEADTVLVAGGVLDFSLAPAESGTRLQVLPPLPTYLETDPDSGSDPDESHRINDGSIGVLLERGPAAHPFRMFLAGDGEVEANQRWRTTFAAATADLEVLKVGHHGANNAVFDNGFSGSSRWLEHTDPAVAIISSNGTTHPRQAALGLLLGRPGLRTYCTHVHGDITLRARADGAYQVTVERNADMDCVAGSEATT